MDKKAYTIKNPAPQVHGSEDIRTILLQEILGNIKPGREITFFTDDNEMIHGICIRDFYGETLGVPGLLQIDPRYRISVEELMERVGPIIQASGQPEITTKRFEPLDNDEAFSKFMDLKRTISEQPHTIIHHSYLPEAPQISELVRANAASGGISIIISRPYEIAAQSVGRLISGKVNNEFDPDVVNEMVLARRLRPEGLREEISFYTYSPFPNLGFPIRTLSDIEIRRLFKYTPGVPPFILTSAAEGNDYTWLGFHPDQLIANVAEALSSNGQHVHVLNLDKFTTSNEEGKFTGHNYDGIMAKLAEITESFYDGDLLIFRNTFSASSIKAYLELNPNATPKKYWEDRKVFNTLIHNAKEKGVLIRINGR